MSTAPYKFTGGIVPVQETPESLRTGIRDQPLAERLSIPLVEYWGDFSIPVVKIGDRVKRGQLIATHRHPLGVPRYAPTSGVIKDITEHPLGHPSGLSGPCIVIVPDGDDIRVSDTAMTDYRMLDPQQLLQKIYTGGVTGMGGGGFPVHTKLATAKKAGVSLLIINALECEPLISCDEVLIKDCSDDIIKGIGVLLQLLQPARCVIAIKEDMTGAQNLLERSINLHPNHRIEVVSLPNIYPIGSEKLLIYCLTGIHLDADSIPAAAGIVCQNVASVKAIFDAVVHDQPVTSRITTIAGENILNPANVRVRLGTPVQELLTGCSENTSGGQQLLLGGPLNGYALHHPEAPIDAHHNCILSRPVANATTTNTQPCIKCGYCADVCPAQLLPQRLLWHTQAGQFTHLSRFNIAECIECGACDTVCPSNLPLTNTFRFAKGQIRLHRWQLNQAGAAQLRFQKHQQRMIALQEAEQQKLEERRLNADKKSNASIVEAALARAKNRKSPDESQS